MYQITTKYTKVPQNITNGRKIDQLAKKYTSIFQCKTLHNLPKVGFHGLKINHLATLVPCLQSRLTRLGEFKPIGWVLTLRGFFITEVAQMFGLFFQGKSYVLICDKNELSYILGYFPQTHLVTLLQSTNAIDFLSSYHIWKAYITSHLIKNWDVDVEKMFWQDYIYIFFKMKCSYSLYGG
jgi:hypothetical protein